jgi:polysaccharide biosynthesis protein PslJ
MSMDRVRSTTGVDLPAVIAIGALGAVVAVGLGVLSVNSSMFALVGAVIVLLAGVATRDLTIVPVLAVPATLVLTRVGPLSVSDVLLAVAALCSLLMLRGRGAQVLRPLLWAGVFYLATAIPTQILNPYGANVVEWFHEAVLVLGSLIVGFVIGRNDRARLALTAYVLACGVIGVIAAVVSLTTLAQSGAFQPVFLGDLNKNTIGGMLGAAAVIAFARPIWLRWPPGWSWTLALICTVGVLAAQSRQGIVGEIVGVLLVSLRARPQTGRRVRIVWLAAIPGVAWVVSILTAQLASSDAFNSAHQRVDWYQQAFEIWLRSPLFGSGMRWWYTDRFAGEFQSFQPPNAELEVLTTVGVFGLIGFLALFGVGLWVLWRMDPVYGTVGVAVVATRFAQAQFDLYWVAGQASLLWIVAGICYGVQALDRDRRSRGEPIPWEALRSSGPRARGPRRRTGPPIRVAAPARPGRIP